MAIVPVLGRSVILIRQFRISIGREIIELPAGRLEKGESIVSCAKRELEEEVGYRTGKIIKTVSYYSSAGFTNEIMHIFLAFDLTKTEKKNEWDERIRIVKFPIREIEHKLERNLFEDSKTIIGLRELLFYIKKHPEII